VPICVNKASQSLHLVLHNLRFSVACSKTSAIAASCIHLARLLNLYFVHTRPELVTFANFVARPLNTLHLFTEGNKELARTK